MITIETGIYDTIDNLQKENEQLRAKIDELKGTVNTYPEVKEWQDLRYGFKELSSNNEEQMRHIIILEKQKQEWYNAIDALNNENDDLLSRHNKLKERNEYLEEVENEYADKDEETYRRNKQLKAKVDELEEMMIVQEKDYALLEKDIDKYESIIKGLKKQNEQLEKDVHILELKEETQEDFCNACSWCP